MAEGKGFDLNCDSGLGSALTCHRHVIHSLTRSNPNKTIEKEKKAFLTERLLLFLAEGKGFEPL